MMETAMVGSARPRKLDILKNFEVWALDLNTAVIKGRILHGSGNIKESGQHLEEQFRSYFLNRVRHPLDVPQGYFVKPNGDVSAQADVIIFDERFSSKIVETVDGTRYISHSGVHLLCELKTSSVSLDGAFSQISNLLAQHKEGNVEYEYAPPLSMILIADTSKLECEEVKSIYLKYLEANLPAPEYLVLLDRACIITRSPAISITPFTNQANLSNGPLLVAGEKLVSGNVGIWAPSEKLYARGKVLLWLYHEIIHAVQKLSSKRVMPVFSYMGSFRDESREVARAIFDIQVALNNYFDMTDSLKVINYEISQLANIRFHSHLEVGTLPDCVPLSFE